MVEVALVVLKGRTARPSGRRLTDMHAMTAGAMKPEPLGPATSPDDA